MQDIQEYYNTYSTSENGLNHAQVEVNRKQHGTNALEVHKPEPLWKMALKEITALFPLLLLSAALLSLFAHFQQSDQGYDIIAYALFFVVGLNATVSLLQKRKVENMMLSFSSYIPRNVLVVRDGIEQQIDTADLVVGDIIKIAEGDKIPGDAIIITQNQLSINESILTGESAVVNKTNFEGEKGELYSGTTVVNGNCVALVTAVGAKTKFGGISSLTQSVERPQTPMQKEINRFVKIITSIALVLGVVFFVVGVLFLDNPFMTNLIFAIGIIVANVPEGLLPTVTLALTQASARMAKRKSIVKSLESVETLGSCTVICTDKTGTLTQNKMTVAQIFANNTSIAISGNWSKDIQENPAHTPLLEVMLLCNNASILVDKHARTYFGDPTETALLEFADKSCDSQAVRSEFEVLDEKPFSSIDKFMSKTFRTKGGSTYTCVKGAPEIILQRCSHVHLDGSVHEITAEERHKLVEQKVAYEKEGLRVLGLAYAATPINTHDPRDIIFVGYVAMIDPPRPEVAQAVESCKTAGIQIIVISGDTVETVAAIARKTGIAQNPRAITGSQLKEMTDAQLIDELKNNKEILFARTIPEQKMQIVQALQKLGHVVAVTGDGVNDAPALKTADIGVSMGKGGTDVAKDASDIILLDDNFATIVKAIKEGRTVYDNIKRFITYILTSNVPEIIPFIAMVIFNVPLAITVIQILAIDLITDILPAIGLGNEPSEKDVMQRSPRKKTDKLVTKKMFLRSYGIVGPIQALLAYIPFFFILTQSGWQWGQEASGLVYMQATVAFLATIVFAQIGNVMACRTRVASALSSVKVPNRWITYGIAVEIVFILLITSVPALQNIMHAQPLSVDIWIWLLLAPIVIFAVEEIRKFLVRRGVTLLQT